MSLYKITSLICHTTDFFPSSACHFFYAITKKNFTVFSSQHITVYYGTTNSPGISGLPWAGPVHAIGGKQVVSVHIYFREYTKGI